MIVFILKPQGQQMHEGFYHNIAKNKFVTNDLKEFTNRKSTF